jgi:hypothetical protein
MLALARLEGTGKSRSEAIRAALVDAASRLSDKRALPLRWRLWKPTRKIVLRCRRSPNKW